MLRVAVLANTVQNNNVLTILQYLIHTADNILSYQPSSQAIEAAGYVP